MFNFALSILLIISATLIGNSYSQRLTNRRKCLGEVIEAISKMRSLMAFTASNIESVVYESFKETHLSAYFAEKRPDSDDFFVWWSDAVGSIDKSTGINIEDKDLLVNFGKGLGVTDTEGQLAHLELYSELFTQRLNGAKDSEREKGRLYRVLGFSLGCAVTLIIV